MRVEAPQLLALSVQTDQGSAAMRESRAFIQLQALAVSQINENHLPFHLFRLCPRHSARDIRAIGSAGKDALRALQRRVADVTPVLVTGRWSLVAGHW
ncbi:MAG TPA: hypothetical protein VH951_00285 [Dehalococcoidia bacterium]